MAARVTLNMKWCFEMTDLQESQIKTLFEIIDELLKVLKATDPKLGKALISNSKLNDYYLIRAGAK